MTIEERSTLASAVVEKMMYMCGCRNCITKIEQIIMDDIKPFDNQCDNCGLCDLPDRGIRKKGHWEYSSGCMDCSACGLSYPDTDIWGRKHRFGFCPNCGAIMED